MKKRRALTRGVWLLAFIAVFLQSPAYLVYAQNPNSSLNQAAGVGATLDSGTNRSPEWRVEPVVRVGLITDSESVAVSAEGSGLVAEVGSDVRQPLDSSFVKVQTRPAQIIETSPVPTPARQTTYSYVIRVTELRNRSEADVAARDVNLLTGRETRIFQLPENPKKFVVELDAGSSDPEAMHLKMLLEEQGFLVEIVRTAGTSRLVPAVQTIGYSVPTVPVVKSTARTTSMRSETLVFGSKSSPLLSAREPVVFAPLKPGTPLTINSRTYRGKIEIFSNPKGRLTVVYVVQLEDYVNLFIYIEL
jgi:hypothetical protein